MTAEIIVLYYSGSGHTKILANNILSGVKSINKKAKLINVQSIDERGWQQLISAKGIMLGSPTYLGGVAGQFKLFLDQTSQKGFWRNQMLVDKMAAGFTVATYPSGDKLNTLVQLALFAAQHGMIWVNNDELGSKVKPENGELNQTGSWLGLMATSVKDKTQLISQSDKDTAYQFGIRFARQVARFN